MREVHGHLESGPCQCSIDAARRARIEQLIGSAGIPSRFAGRGLADIDGRHADIRDQLVEYVESWPTKRGLAIVGDMGTGKTAHAYAMIHDLCARGVQAVAVNVADLLDDLSRPDHRGSERMDVLGGADLLLLDDFGAHRTSDWAIGSVYGLINRRYGAERPTCVTSMFGLSQLAKEARDKRLSLEWSACVDRIKETCNVLVMRGTSRRAQAVGLVD